HLARVEGKGLDRDNRLVIARNRGIDLAQLEALGKLGIGNDGKHAVSGVLVHDSTVSGNEGCANQPRPTSGIAVAMTVMNCTFASSGKEAMWSTAATTCSESMVGSGLIVPSACSMPASAARVMSVAALPMSICPQAIR